MKIDRIKRAVCETRAHYEETPFNFEVVSEKLFDKKLTYEVLKNYNLKNKNIVDIGCGMSFVGRYIKKNYPAYKYIGIDISRKAVEFGQKIALDIREGNNLSIELPDGYSDFTISDGVIHHTPAPWQCFRELIRITKKEGYIFLYVYNRNNYYYFLYKSCFFVRQLYRNKLTRKFVSAIIFRMFDIFYVQLGNKLFLKGKESISRPLSWNIFSDQVLTPIAHFFTKREILDFAHANNLLVTKMAYSFNRQGLMFLFKKGKC